MDNTNDSSPNVTEEEAGHGTSCAGEIAMVRNDKCGVGVAYRSNIAGMYCSICFMFYHCEHMYALEEYVHVLW